MTPLEERPTPLVDAQDVTMPSYECMIALARRLEQVAAEQAEALKEHVRLTRPIDDSTRALDDYNKLKKDLGL